MFEEGCGLRLHYEEHMAEFQLETKRWVFDMRDHGIIVHSRQSPNRKSRNDNKEGNAKVCVVSLLVVDERFDVLSGKQSHCHGSARGTEVKDFSWQG